MLDKVLSIILFFFLFSIIFTVVSELKGYPAFYLRYLILAVGLFVFLKIIKHRT